jgi:hypothetical protein
VLAGSDIALRSGSLASALSAWSRWQSLDVAAHVTEPVTGALLTILEILILATMPLIVTLFAHLDASGGAAVDGVPDEFPAYLAVRDGMTATEVVPHLLATPEPKFDAAVFRSVDFCTWIIRKRGWIATVGYSEYAICGERSSCAIS